MVCQSKSKAQQKFMGAGCILKKGDLKPSDTTPAVRKVAKDMKNLMLKILHLLNTKVYQKK